MSALDHLAALLRPAVQHAVVPLTPAANIDTVVADAQRRAKSTGTKQMSEDHQLDAVRRFWESQEIATFRDAYLVSWGLCLPYRPNGPCVMEDRPRFQLMLDGVDGWTVRPSAYRRCYQGLVKSYFTYDARMPSVPPVGRSNWKLLRDYLHDRNGSIRDKQANPDWVDTAVGNRHLFGADPCEPFVPQLLEGNSSIVDHLCTELRIDKTSWFLEELVLAQIAGATTKGNAKFQELLPKLLQILAGNEFFQSRGLTMLLDRYVTVPNASLHQGLRDSAVALWGNPWLPSNDTGWIGVRPEARTMVADWLKLEFIETFFTKLAQDGVGDRRRMEFWKRYVKSISHIEFALGSTARSDTDPDFVVLRDKMNGLIRHLEASGKNNAFIMNIGNLVAVEFGGMGNAFYGYDARANRLFDTSKPLRLAVNDRNSLKHDAHILKMSHQDGIHNWDKWEQMFEATLREEFGIEAGASAPAGAAIRRPTPPVEAIPQQRPALDAWNVAANLTQSYSRSALNKFANQQGLRVDDKTPQGGSLWVRADAGEEHIAKMLTRWGFQHKPGKGWWK